MSIKLIDTQRIMLSAAAESPDRCLIAPKTLKGGAVQKVAAKLIAAGLVKETRAKAGAPVWRRNEHALRLTAAGAKAIGIDENRGSDEANDGNERAHAPPDIPPPEAGPTLSAPRNGAKLAQVIELLQRDRGATLDELVASDRLASSHNARCPHGLAQAWLHGRDGPVRQAARIDLSHPDGSGRG